MTTQAHDFMALAVENYATDLATLKRFFRLCGNSDVVMCFPDSSFIVFERGRSWRTDRMFSELDNSKLPFRLI